MKDNKLDKKDKIEKISLGRFMISADMAAASCLPQAAGAAAAAHDSGDAAVMCGLPDGSLAFILSDGMGQGMKAAAESRTAIRRLRKALREGTPATAAIRELNRYMIRRSGSDENFATIDLTIINKQTGRCHFYKMGAATSFLVRDGHVKRIQRAALPIGIISQAGPAHISLKLRPGDILAMVSDGITEADRSDMAACWLEQMLSSEETEQMGPRILAENIAAKALARSSRTNADDCTVVIAKIL